MSQRKVMHPAKNCLETIDGSGLGLRITFSHQARHIGHSIAIVDHDQEYPTLISLEGDDQQAFPPSPALQQLVIKRQSNGLPTAMLIGMADRNHWSLSIQPMAKGNGLLFDVACRCQNSNAPFLGSSYRLRGHPTSVSSGNLFRIDQSQPYGYLKAVSDATLLSETFANRDAELIIQPRWTPSMQTQRWCYQLKVLPANAALPH